jgi:RNA polymerase sigma factor (sigma-70 family)
MAAVPHVGRGSDISAGATHQLYEQYGRQIYAYCLHRLRSREDAEDAVQTTFLNAFRSLQKGTVTEFEQAWLFKIAQNVCLERTESSGRRSRVESPSDLHVLQEIAPAHEAQDSEQLIGIEDALAGMPANQRKAILLREWQGLSYREVGAELGLSQSSVEMLIFRARRTLANALEKPLAESKKRRGGRALNIGSLVTALKALLTGGTAVKAVAVAVTAGTVAIVGSRADVHHLVTGLAPHHNAKPKPAALGHAWTASNLVAVSSPRVRTSILSVASPPRARHDAHAGIVAAAPAGVRPHGARRSVPIDDAPPAAVAPVAPSVPGAPSAPPAAIPAAPTDTSGPASDPWASAPLPPKPTPPPSEGTGAPGGSQSGTGHSSGDSSGSGSPAAGDGNGHHHDGKHGDNNGGGHGHPHGGGNDSSQSALPPASDQTSSTTTGATSTDATTTTTSTTPPTTTTTTTTTSTTGTTTPPTPTGDGSSSGNGSDQGGGGHGHGNGNADGGDGGHGHHH